MGATIVQMEIPDDLLRPIGSTEAAAEQAREALIIEMLRQHRITQGKASELLGITRGEMVDLAARYEVSSGMEDAEELRQQINRIVARNRQASGESG